MQANDLEPVKFEADLPADQSCSARGIGTGTVRWAPSSWWRRRRLASSQRGQANQEKERRHTHRVPMLNNSLVPATPYRMRRRKDLTGQTFDRLTATSCVGVNKKGEALWACDCICGGTTTVRASRLRSAETRSCGCLRSPFADLTAQTFGQLTAIKFEERKDHTTWWICDCTCGKTKLVRADHLKSGAIRSCGCETDQRPWLT